jgi:hypothetical protein
LQFLHFPLKNKKLKTGISSYQERVFIQDIHPLLPPKERCVLSRIITTFKKLPIMRPKIKKITVSIIIIDILYHINKNKKPPY